MLYLSTVQLKLSHFQVLKSVYERGRMGRKENQNSSKIGRHYICAKMCLSFFPDILELTHIILPHCHWRYPIEFDDNRGDAVNR